MRPIPIPLVSLLLALHALPCAAQVPGVAPEDGFRPLRFGDPAADVAPFFPGADHDPALPAPDELLGQALGTRLSHPAEILACFRRWAELSPRLRLSTYGRTHEGRELVVAAVSTPANLERLEAIQADLARLWDARRETLEAELEAIVARSPAVAWMGYSIHGDEVSGCDAALALAHHLIASRDADVLELLENVVVAIDPCMNPDGRERIVGMVEQSSGATPSLDHDSMQRGRWPWGRGNHYLFDMNRDWMAGTQPETRGRWAAIGALRPQLLVDAHEMGALDTYLFYPQEKPHNPFLSPELDRWHRTFALGVAGAFDGHGWSYYTREWADGWGPFYSDAWGSLNGAIGILYEQSGTSGFPLVRASGRTITYRESVHHQVAASLANLRTLAAHREAVLRDWAAGRRRAVAVDTPGNDRALALPPGPRADRRAALARALLAQGVEIERATEDFDASGAASWLGEAPGDLSLAAGTWIVRARQPQRALVRAYLDFDVRLDDEALRAEREELERRDASRIYDDTAWSLPLAFDLESYWIDAPDVATEPLPAPAPAAGAVTGDVARPVAWAVDGARDASVAFAARALELGLAVHLSDVPFEAGEPARRFARGSLVVRASENEADVAARVERAAREAGVEVLALETQRAPGDGPDLGGGHFALLARPRVGLVSNAPARIDAFGHLWHLLDREVGVPLSMLDAQSFGRADLRRFNVIVLPPAWGRLGGFLEEHGERLRAWVEAGGTLIACGDAAGSVCAPDVGLSSVVRRRDVLEELDGWRFAAERERRARELALDPALVWDGPGEETADAGEDAEDDEPPRRPDVDPDAERQDAWMRRFAPRGAFVLGHVDPDTWLTAGCDARLPVLVDGDLALHARRPVRTAVRLAPAADLRLSGLLWPEARERLADSAWATVERVGRGQVVLFASVPGYRGYCRATGRLLANAVVYGPGAGADAPVGW